MCYNKRLWNTQNACDAPDARIPISSSGKTNLRQAQGSWQPSAKESPSNIMDERFKLSSCSIFFGDILYLPYRNNDE